MVSWRVDGRVERAECAFPPHAALHHKDVLTNCLVNKVFESGGYPSSVALWFEYHITKCLQVIFNSDSQDAEARRLPGMDIVIESPCPCIREMSMFDAIQHLNDRHRWTREKIAGWIDNLHDSGEYDFTFNVEIGE